jgi:hypothetical protein
MPTRLGNILRRVEDFAGDRYGIDAVGLTPYLLSVASPDLVSQYEDARTELDVTVKLVYVWFISTVVSLLALVDDGPWLALPAFCFGMAFLSYHGSLEAAGSFGTALAQVVDLHRFDLIEKLRWPPPKNLAAEFDSSQPLWRIISDEAASGDDNIEYVHPSPYGPAGSLRN